MHRPLIRLVPTVALVWAAGVVVPARGQSLNIDFGDPANAPPSSYAGAGVAGVWNSIPAHHNTYTFNLLGLDGNPTPVRLWQYGGTQTLTADNPATSGADDALMDDFLITYTSNLETCIFLRFLQPGTYEIILYAQMPNEPDIMSYTSCDEEPGYPHHEVGGAWSGGHAEFVTYATHVASPDPTFNQLRMHSGISPLGNPRLGAALNGMQIRKLTPGDCTGEGLVNVNDLLSVVGAWGPCPNPGGTCPPDLNNDDTVNVNDLLEVVGNWD